MNLSNPFKSVYRKMVMICILPATAFLAFAGLYSVGADHYEENSSGVVVRVVSE
jgi:hypothetical protein